MDWLKKDKDSEKALNAVLKSITNSLSVGEKVAMVGSGSFEVKECAKETCKNPKTKEKMIVPAFKASKGLKDTVAK